MHVQSGTTDQQAIFAEANSRAEDRRPVDIVLASDAHGAFVWGVLDRLLDEPGFALNAIAASGFAAVEAAVLAYGLALGGRRGARMALTNFWRRVSHASMSDIDRGSLLRSILEQSIDIGQIRDGSSPVKLSILAANARTDALKIFTSDQLSIDAIVAAATVPFLSRPVEIDGDLYWGDADLAEPPAARSLEARHRLVIAGKPSLFMAPCPNRNGSANRCAIRCAPVHTIFDNQHRTGAALFLRPWTDWGELTDMRDRGRQRAGDWLVANLVGFDEAPAINCEGRYI
ncbi:Esterase of the alpha-beta hydrolase superfamily protein [Mesorhizobium sp. ORS 3324]|nr:Esterase of the alpha-beta hydrolase superfamily protein [Mesorhizobium sp. ORS 3324]